MLVHCVVSVKLLFSLSGTVVLY